MYDPTPGRWLSEDPLGLDAEDPDLYRYVGNNPVNAIDPTGLKAKPDITKDGTFDGGATTIDVRLIRNAIDVQRKEGIPHTYGSLVGVGPTGAEAGPVKLSADKYGARGEKAVLAVISGIDVFLVANFKAKADVDKYYWRQYVTVKAKSDNADIKRSWKGTETRQVDNAGQRDDKYPVQVSDKDEATIAMIDRPGARLTTTIRPEFTKKSDDEKEVTISIPDNAAGKAYITALLKAVNGKYGLSNTEIEFKFETELVYKEGAKKTVKGTWQWGFKITWKKEGEGAQASYTPIITSSEVKWVVSKK